MLGIFKRKKVDKPTKEAEIAQLETSDEQTEAQPQESAPEEAAEVEQDEPKAGKVSFFKRLRQGLQKTRENLGEGLAKLVLGKKKIDADLLEEIETELLMADVGIEATNKIITHLTDSLKRNQLADGDALYRALKEQLLNIISPLSAPLLPDNSHTPFVILMVGVNGAGKTTTIGKIANRFKVEGKKVMLAAGDTFRAAAVEQLEVWGERNGIDVIAQHERADSASVIYDAFEAAKARNVDVLLADTAGRLHTQGGLMDELKKVKRVIQKLDESAPHEVMLVLDASIGQNALNQAMQFNEAVGVTGITMTKLDGTAKGGILFAIADKLGIPFRFIGVGETLEDLRPFDGSQFIDALFD